MRLLRAALYTAALISSCVAGHTMGWSSTKSIPYTRPPFYHCVESEHIVFLHPITQNNDGKVSVWARLDHHHRILATLESRPVIVYRNSRGNNVRAAFISQDVTAVDNGIQSISRYRGEKDSIWTLSTTYILDKDNTILVQQSLWSNAPQKLVRFEGITLRAGDGSFGPSKSEALFPGLEYLLG